MGLDIQVITDNQEELCGAEYLANYAVNRSQHGLSRAFCNFICRRNVVEHEAELDQMACITGIDISSIYEMETYPDEEMIRSYLEYDADTEEKKRAFLIKVERDRSKLDGNIDRVFDTVNTLIDKLSVLDELNKKLIQTDFDTLNCAYYFADFKTDKGDGYSRNNFGKDLRNFKRFLVFAKERGTKTVWFQFG